MFYGRKMLHIKLVYLKNTLVKLLGIVRNIKVTNLYTPMTNPTNKEAWIDELYELAEKYCKHDDREYNSCLFHIFKEFIDPLIKTERQEERERLLDYVPDFKTKEQFEMFIRARQENIEVLKKSIKVAKEKLKGGRT